MLKQLSGKTELVTYSDRVKWVKYQMEHAKTLARSAHYGGKTWFKFILWRMRERSYFENNLAINLWININKIKSSTTVW